VFTARYAQSPYKTQVQFVFKRFNNLPLTIFNISALSIEFLLQNDRENAADYFKM
jgi:hypothetical protein